MKISDYIVISSITLAASCFAAENIGTEKRACEVYQGYKNTSDTRVIYVFDSQPANKRKGSPNYNLISDSYWKKATLNKDSIGKRFCFIYIDPISFIRKEKILKTVTRDTSILEKRLIK